MTDSQLWWLTLGIGLVVAVVAWVLLQLLYVSVKRIDRNVRDAWETATRLAANTATTWMLTATPAAVEGLSHELAEHDRLLSDESR